MSSTFRVWARQLRRALGIRDIRIGVGILAGGVALVGLLLLVYPALAPSVTLQLISTFVAAVGGIYLSHALVVHRIRKTDSDRIDSSGALCARYRESVDLLDATHLEGLDPSYGGELPVVVPDTSIFTGGEPEFPVVASGDVYDLPDAVGAFLEPRFDELRSRFNNEGKHNRRTVRIDAITDGTARISESSYFRTYCTNYSPDFTGGSGRLSLRDAFDADLVTGDGLEPLDRSPFSNTLSGGGLVVTTDGTTIVGLKSMDATVGELELADSFGGNVEYPHVVDGGVTDDLLREAREEVDSVTVDNVRSWYGLGVVRRLDWLGQPNVHSVLLIDTEADLAHSGTEHIDSLVVAGDRDGSVGPEEIADPEFARETVAKVLEACDGSAHTPGVTLLTTLEMWLRRTAAEDADADESRTA